MRKKPVAESVLELARERIANIYDRFDHVAVHFSGGKDSTVCLNLTLEEAHKRGRLPLDVVFFDEEAQAPDTIEYMARVQAHPDVALRWYCLPVKHRNACSRREPYWRPWEVALREKWCRELPRGAITMIDGFNDHATHECNGLLYPPSMGQVGVILGIRTQESLRRFRSVTKRTYENYISVSENASHVMVCKPIYDWTTDDVWTAPKQFGWDYNRAYDVMTQAGIPRHVQRVCPPYGEEPLQNLWMYSVCWPDLWAKMSMRVPGAATGGKYCRSPIYAFGGLPPKPDDVTWEQHVRSTIMMWPEPTRQEVAAHVRDFIKLHHRDAPGVPIVFEPHAVSGVGWKLLYKIAFRGDLKNRQNRKLASKELAP